MPDAPLTISLRPGPTWDSYATTAFPDQPDAVEYIRKDAADAMLEHAANTLQRMQLRSALQAALEASEDNDSAGATQILRTCLSRL